MVKLVVLINTNESKKDLEPSKCSSLLLREHHQLQRY